MGNLFPKHRGCVDHVSTRWHLQVVSIDVNCDCPFLPSEPLIAFPANPFALLVIAGEFFRRRSISPGDCAFERILNSFEFVQVA